jgi:hypothetical protein
VPDPVRFALPGRRSGIKPCVPTEKCSPGPTRRMAAVNTLKLWLRPAMLLVLWFLVTAFTLSEVATVAPLLRASGAERPRLAQARQAAR